MLLCGGFSVGPRQVVENGTWKGLVKNMTHPRTCAYRLGRPTNFTKACVLLTKTETVVVKLHQSKLLTQIGKWRW